MDLYENKDNNLMTATFELPGLAKDNIQIDVQDGNLAVSGESSQSSEQREQGYAVKERKYGRFVRTIRLPDGTKVRNEFPFVSESFQVGLGSDGTFHLQSKDIKASMENGILTVTYPKSSPGQEAQRITIG